MRAPQWRALLNSFVLGAALSLHAASTLAATFALSGTPPASTTVGSTYTFKPTVSGANGAVYFAIDNKPSWAGFSTVTGTLTGKPTAANVGTSGAITIRATTKGAFATLKSFTVTVKASSGSTTPTSTTFALSGTPPSSVKAGTAYTFKPTVSGAHGTVYFAIDNKPSWASFSTVSGTLSGTPTAANVGTSAAITIRATTTGAWASTKAFTISVLSSSGTTTTPTVTISGTPPTSVTAGSAYRFQPTAKDSAGKTLSYSVQHAPSWASFSVASGLLSGTPTSSQVGTYSGVIVSASDGTASSALPAFTITVKSLTAATGSATLNWVEPTKNTDGSPLTNLAGTYIHYGTSPSNLTQRVQVAGAGQSSYTISNLTAGTWYFGAAAYTTTGVEGMMSQIESKTVP
jgi:hypothetical protein